MGTPLLLRAWREVLEHFVHALIQILDVLLGFVGERVAFGASPDQLLRLAIEEIDDHRAHLICFSSSRGLTKTSATKTPPSPASSEAVIECIQGLLILGDLDGID